MFTIISWKNYIINIVAISSVYYFYIWIKYYFKKSFRQIKLKKAILSRSLPGGMDIKSVSENISGNELNVRAEELIELLNKKIADAARQAFNRDDFKKLINQMLRLYPTLSQMPYRQKINKIIIALSDNYSLAALREEEVEQWWSD